MAAAKYDVLIEEGATFYRKITIREPAQAAVPPNPATGEAGKPAVAAKPVNLTGQIARGQLRANYLEATSLIATFTCTILDAANGVIGVEIPASVTAGLVADADKGALYDGTADNITIGYYDIETVHTNGFVTRILQGAVRYSDEITR